MGSQIVLIGFDEFPELAKRIQELGEEMVVAVNTLMQSISGSSLEDRLEELNKLAKSLENVDSYYPKKIIPWKYPKNYDSLGSIKNLYDFTPVSKKNLPYQRRNY